MRFKFGNTIVSLGDHIRSVMVILSDADKRNIAAMPEGNNKYACFLDQDGGIPEHAEAMGAWMDASYSPLTPAAFSVLEERHAQTTKGHVHDDQYQRHQLIDASMAYACAAKGHHLGAAMYYPWPGPFAAKATARSRRENLVVAAALLLAEIERIDRAEAQKAEAAEGQANG